MLPHPATLTLPEQATLHDCEQTIERGLATFLDVGNALIAVRDARLYRATHTAFDDYCRQRWGMSKTNANRLIDAARVAENLTPIGVIPANEAQARPLALLPDAESQREVWQEVVDTAGEHGITAAWVQRVVDRKIAVSQGRPLAPPTPPLPAGKYSLILADPPWRYDFASATDRSVETHYPTMSTDALCTLPVSGLAATDCVLLLWATSPKLPEALGVMAAWGFGYKTCAVWHKSGLGMGYYWRQDHELLLLGTRGAPGTPDPSNRLSSVIAAPKGAHSVKPDLAYEIIEAMYPHAARLELFARSARPGWAVWGNDPSLA